MRAIQLSPDQGVLHITLVNVLWRLEDLDGALKEIERAGKCNLTPEEEAQLLDLRRQIRRQMGDSGR